MGKACLIFIASVFLTVFLPSVAHAATYYVSPTGNDSGAGTISSPWKTINKGVSGVGSGDTLYLRGGTYTGTVSISKSGSAGNPVTIAGYPGETPIINGGGGMGEYSALFSLTGNYVNLKNMEITGGGMGLVIKGYYDVISQINSHHHISNGILITGTSNGSIVEDSIVHDTCEYNKNGSGGHWASGLTAARNPSNAIIRRNKVYNNWGEGLSAYGGANGTLIEDNIVYDNWSVNLYIQNSSNDVVQRNLIYRSPNYFPTSGTQTGIVEDNEPADSGYGNSTNNKYLNNLVMGTKGNFVHWSGSTGMSNALVANNTFVNTSGRANIDISGTNSNVRFINNIIIQDDSTQIIARGGGGVTFSNNLWSRTPPGNFLGANSLVGNPLLAGTGGIGPAQLSPGWFMLTSGSPAINRGLVLPEVIADFFNNSRIDIPDIGAHEFGGSATRKLGDANEDGIVNGADFSIWLNNYSKIIPTPVTNSHRNGDFNSDGVVNGADFSIWLNNYGR